MIRATFISAAEKSTQADVAAINDGTAVEQRCSHEPEELFQKPPPPGMGNFCPSSLQQYGVGGGGGSTLLTALQQRETLSASLCIFPLGGGGDEEEEGTLSPLAALASGLGGALDVLNCTSSWGPLACGSVSATSWRSTTTTTTVVKGIQSQLRLAAFLGLRAVMVPLPDYDGDESDGGGAFAAAVATLTQHLRLSQTTNIWVRCDASCQAQRAVFSRLRSVLLWGTTPPSATEAAGCLPRWAIHRVAPYLHFSQTFGALPSEWLGEPVVAFEVPSVDKLERVLRSAGDGSCVRLPSDVMPLVASYWGTAQPLFISLGAFVVELLRRRAAPIFFSDGFLDSYNIINQLYERCVVDEGRDTFRGFEDVLQLPLQPLGHMLPSGVYEVFEQDRTKYQQYHAALLRYLYEWLAHREERSHARLWKRYSNQVGNNSVEDALCIVLLGAGRGPLIEECLNVASGLGVRIHLLAVDKNPEAVEFVRLRLCGDAQWFEWINTYGHVVEVLQADGRAISAAVVESQEKASQPSKWGGLCDLVVSELLGSFGDNELSPECLDDFHDDLLRYQSSVGIPANPYLTSIPQQYTAWIAPLHSGWVEEAVAEAAVSGLTVPPPHCHDPRAAVFNSIFVSNVCRALALSPPEPCWTFQHFLAGGQRKEREAQLQFHLCTGGRLSGFIGYFSAVLFAPSAAHGAGDLATPLAPVTLSTASHGRTPDLFSWFPCILAVEPRDVLEARAGDVLHLHLRRCVSVEEGRMWYSYNTVLRMKQEHKSQRDAPVEIPPVSTALINNLGWAASALLSS